MTIPHVTNMTSPRTGKPVANQYVIDIGEDRYFQSYDSIIAKRSRHNIAPTLKLDKNYWNYSRTTLKYLKEFINEHLFTHDIHSKKDIQAKIDSGEYILADLNKGGA